MAGKKFEDMTPEEQREHRAAELRRSNENRNQAQLDRRNAIADQGDELREPELDDIVDGEIVRRRRAKPEDTEAAAAEEERLAEVERERLEQENAESLNADEIQANNDRIAEEETDGDASDSKLINGTLHYLLVINGKEKWLTLSQIRDKASKVEAADEYLHDAAESARRAVSLQTSQGEETEEVDTETEELLNKALLGDQESVKKLARRLNATPSRVTPDVLQAVDERMTFRDAVSWFEGEFETELKDPRLKKMIVDEDVRLAAENPTWGYRKRLGAAGKNIREWRRSMGGASSTGSDGSARLDKQQRKQQLSPVVGAGRRQGSERDEDAEEPVSAQIERMAAGRHQARAIKH